MLIADWTALIHPMLAVVVVFPLIGMVVRLAVLTRQRRLQVLDHQKSKIAPTVGPEHLQLGRWLSAWVIAITIIALLYSIVVKSILRNDLWATDPTRVVIIALMVVATIASFVLLYWAKPARWRAIFATLTGMGLVILGCQDGVFRRGYEWYTSHYYYGILAALLMVFSLAIVADIYQDRQHRWRRAHIVLNIIAVLLFAGQGFTGARDLLEIPLSWQMPYIYQCDFQNLTCPQPGDGNS
jgi:phosphoglycerol transferase MdoB-like AlkP superfamily enzyme